MALSSDETRSLVVNTDLEESLNDINLEDERAENNSNPGTRRWKKNDFINIIILCTNNVGNGMVYALMASFFPVAAPKEKGISIADVGIILAALPIASVIFGFVFTHFIDKIGTRRLLLGSVLLAAIALVPFSLVMYIPAGAKFYSACIISRAFQGIAFVGTQLAAFSIASCDYKDRMSTVLGLLEMSIAVGMCLGPAIGGVIYDSWGFVAPFMFLCVFNLILLLLNYIWIHPKFENAETETLDGDYPLAGEFSFKDFWKIPVLLIPTLNVFYAFNCYSFFDVSFGPFLSSTFNMSATVIGSIFLCIIASSAIASPIVGLITDKKGHGKLLMVIGCFIVAPTFMLIGPVSYFNLEHNLGLTIGSASIMCVGFAMLYVPMVDVCIDIVVMHNYACNDKTRTTITNLVVTTGNLGNAVGPFVAGFLVNSYGFEMSAFYFGLASTILGTTAIIPFLSLYFKKKSQQASLLRH